MKCMPMTQIQLYRQVLGDSFNHKVHFTEVRWFLRCLDPRDYLLLFVMGQSLFIDITLEALVYGQHAATEELVRYVLQNHRHSGSCGNLSDPVPHRSGPYDSYGCDQ